jgi:uncharacterized protein
MDAVKISPETQEKYVRLQSILQNMQKAIVAFSGGVDSTFLLKVGHDVLKDNVFAVIATSETYPEKEIKEAVRLARLINVRYQLIQSREMENPDFVRNPPERCYYCKMELFSRIKEIANARGVRFVLDGANFEDVSDYRPGSRAAEELNIRSPLKEVNLVKSEIRTLSRYLGLPTWNKPAMACLSSRFPYYSVISSRALKQISQAEDYLQALGFSQLRVRHHDSIARIEIPPEQIPRFLDPDLRKKVVLEFTRLGYAYITLDLAGFRSGSLNETLSPSIKNSP